MSDTLTTVTTVTALVPNFLEHGRYLRGWSPRTVQCYQQALATFAPERITKQALQQFVLDLQARGHNPGGVNLIQRAVNSFLTWAHEQGHTDEHHKVRLIRVPKTVITPISAVEVQRLIAFKPRGRAMRRAHTLVMLLLDNRLDPHRIASDVETHRTWELAGLYFMNSGRLYESLALFWGLYRQMLAAQRIGARLHKGMPLVWMSDCYGQLGFPIYTKRYLMLTLVEDALREHGSVSPETTGTYFRLVWPR